ncbi:hypothetical protein BaRGS_00017184 [Batillaria attramentaria]|uniref:Uncharacterized protein n=1 Tax=Batillaria attramentaria TaxID=370345 RepID=A0ABD0KXL1_9CAEN
MRLLPSRFIPKLDANAKLCTTNPQSPSGEPSSATHCAQHGALRPLHTCTIPVVPTSRDGLIGQIAHKASARCVAS